MSSTDNSQHPQHLHPNTRQCAFIKIDGAQCGSPAKRESDHCNFHTEHHKRIYPEHITLPPLEDANAIQVATMDIMNALLYDRIDRAKATGLLYGLQLAQNNLRHLTLDPDARASAGENSRSTGGRSSRGGSTGSVRGSGGSRGGSTGLQSGEKKAARSAYRSAEGLNESDGDYDENGEPLSLAAILLKELRGFDPPTDAKENETGDTTKVEWGNDKKTG